MTEATEVAAEAVENDFLESPPATGVNHHAKAKALISLLSAYERINVKEAAAEEGIDHVSMSRLLPATFAHYLTRDVIATLTNPQNVGQFVVCAIETLGAFANAIAGLTSGIDEKLLNQLVQSMADYSAAPEGSPAEVLADQQIERLVDEINEAVLRVNKHLYAGFADDDSGFVTIAGVGMLSAFEEEEEDGPADEEDDEEDGPTVNG